MTNLFLNDSRTIAMDDLPQINSALAQSNKLLILSNVKQVFFRHFEPALDDCCMRIDVEFGLQLGRNREKMSKDQYIRLLEYLRSIRNEIKQDYLHKINDLFGDGDRKTANSQRGQLDFSKVSLINDDAVKENHAITAIIRQCEHLFYEQLTSLNHIQLAIQPGKQSIADSQNPIFPEKLVRALVEAVKPLKLNTDARIALYKAFEANVFSQLGFIYCELINRCETAVPKQLYVVSEIKEEVEPFPAVVEQPSAEFRLLQKKLELWRFAQFPSSYDSVAVAAGNAFFEHFEIKNALQLLQQFSDDAAPDEKKLPLKWRVLKKLEELSFDSKVKNLAKDDEDVLDLAALLFNRIAEDESIEDAVKTPVLQLEIPMAAVFLGRYSVFTDGESPVRRLLDDMFNAGMFLNADDPGARLIQERVASLVKKLVNADGFDYSGWALGADEFSNYLDKQKQSGKNLEEETKQRMISQQALASNRNAVVATIENSLKGKALPVAVVEFLREVWSEVLLDAYMRKEELPEPWEKSVQAMDELVLSVMPPADDRQRKQVLKLLPGLIAELRKGLKQITYDKAAQSKFFKDLAVWHIILMDKKGETAKDSVMAIQDDKTKAEAIADDSSELAGSLAEQSWVAFTLDIGKRWSKLLWKDTGNMLFVAKTGMKMFEIQADELAQRLRTGQAAIVKMNDKTITERVFTELMSL